MEEYISDSQDYEQAYIEDMKAKEEQEGERSGEPSEKQICEVIDVLMERLPRVHMGRLVEQLSRLIQNDERQGSFAERNIFERNYSQCASRRESEHPKLKRKSPSERKTLAQPKSLFKIENDSKGPILTNKGLVFAKPPLPFRIEQATTYKEKRFLQRQICSLSFCQKGYGVPKMKQYVKQKNLKIQVNDKRHKSVSSSFCTAAFRRLQDFLIDEGKLSIKRASGKEVRVIFTVMFDCREKQFQQAKILVKYVKLIQGIEEVEIRMEESIRLYRNLMIELGNKLKKVRYCHLNSQFSKPKQNKNVRMSEVKYDFSKIWNRKLQKQFYEAYLIEKNIKGVREYFKTKYTSDKINEDPQLLKILKDIWSSASKTEPGCLILPVNQSQSFCQYISSEKILVSKYCKTIRSGVRKFQTYVRNNSNLCPKLLKLYDPAIKAMIGSPRAQEIRDILFKIMSDDNIDPKIVSHTINIINKFNYEVMSEKKKMEEAHELEFQMMLSR